MKAKVCEHPNCTGFDTREARHLNSWHNENGKHWGRVCVACDTVLGREHLIEFAGMTLGEAILFDRYCFLTVNDASPVDWPAWLKEHNETALLNLSLRIWNALRRYNITTITQLAAATESELLEVSNLGPKGIREIKDKLSEYAHE